MVGDLDGRVPEEPLADSAPLAWAIAPGSCPGAPASFDTCLWYHRVWQYLRLLGIITSIRTNTSFLLETFERLADTHPRVLISASADYGMLAHLRHAYGDGPLDVTLVDRCPTTLRLNAWYADRFGIALTTVCDDVLAVEADRPFDLICTHNFVGRFEAEARLRLAERWHALLRPGGVVVTTQRIRPSSHERRASYTREQAGALADSVAAAAAAYAGSLGVTPAALREATFEYALRKGTYVVTARHQITESFERAGFDVNVADEGGGPLEREHDRPSSTAGKDTYRMRLVATRPAGGR
jgi:SAM-dependent methyltransferase